MEPAEPETREDTPGAALDALESSPEFLADRRLTEDLHAELWSVMEKTAGQQ